MFENMSEGKLKKLVTAVVVAGTILIVFLLGVVLYQFISMGVKQSKIDSMNAQISEYEQLIAKLDEDLDAYSREQILEQLAREYGYIYPDDVTMGDLS